MSDDQDGVWVGECFFWYRPTRVVLDKRPLYGCVCVCVCVISQPIHHQQQYTSPECVWHVVSCCYTWRCTFQTTACVCWLTRCTSFGRSTLSSCIWTLVVKPNTCRTSRRSLSPAPLVSSTLRCAQFILTCSLGWFPLITIHAGDHQCVDSLSVSSLCRCVCLSTL